MEPVAEAEDPDRSPLHGVRVLEFPSPLNSYGGRILAALGADVTAVRHEDDVCSAGYFGQEGETWDDFTSIGKRVVPAADLAPGEVLDLARRSDIALVSLSRREFGADAEVLAELGRGTHVVVSTTPRGWESERVAADYEDLLLLARGGLLNLAGSADLPPLRPAGHQAWILSGLHTAVAALIGLVGVSRGWDPRVFDVSAIEAVAHSLENAVQTYSMGMGVRQRRGPQFDEAGTGTFRSEDGYVYLMCAVGGQPVGWPALVAWLAAVDQPASAELADPRWLDAAWRRTDEAKSRFAELVSPAIGARRKHDLFAEAQSFGVSLVPIDDLDDVLSDPHLESIDAFSTVGRARIPSLEFLQGSPLGDARPGDLAPPPGAPALPLAGLTIADFTWVGAGPYATKPLAEWGARVVKVETGTRVDPIRRMQPVRGGDAEVNGSGYFAERNPSKESLLINLKSAGGPELALRLIARSDAVINNMSSGKLVSAGLDPEAAAQRNHRVVYVDMPMFSDAGAYARRRGYGLTVGAITGFQWASNYAGMPADDPGLGTGTNYPDHGPNPLHACAALLAGLFAARTGAGRYVCVDQFASTVNVIGDVLLDHQLRRRQGRSGWNPRGNADADSAVHGVFETAERGRWVAVVARRDAEAGRVAAALGLEQGQDGGMDENVASAISGLQPDDILARLGEQRVGCALVATVADLIDGDEDLARRGHFVELEHPVIGRLVYGRSPYRIDGVSARLSRSPLLGEHTDLVLAEVLGMDESAIADLHRTGTLE